MPGAEISLIRHPDIEFLLFGNSEVVEPLLARMPALKAVPGPHQGVADVRSSMRKRGRCKERSVMLLHPFWHLEACRARRECRHP